MFRASKCLLILSALAVLLFPLAAAAHWDPSMPTKYVQMPDPTPAGMDVNATWQTTQPGGPGTYPYVKVLADDFPCNRPGPITDIHVWGSWLNDVQDPTAVFKLSIHDDVKAGVDADYSHPGALLWQRYFTSGPGGYTQMLWSEGPEQFYDPNEDEIIGADSQMWLYNFNIPEMDAFYQEGIVGAEKVYWLDVQAETHDGVSVFGWKTSVEHWNDDATFADTAGFGGPPVGAVPWKDMHYPVPHPYEGISIDLAFAITTVPEPGAIVLLLTAGMSLLLLFLRRKR